MTGYKFRPSTANNAYLRVAQDDDDGDVESGSARASGAAAGAVEGAAPAVQTIELAKREKPVAIQQTAVSSAGNGTGAAADSGADSWADDNTADGGERKQGAAAPSSSASAAAGAGGAAGKKPVAHAIGDEYDDDEDFGLDELDEDEAAAGEAAPSLQGGDAAGKLKQVNKEKR